MLVNLVRQVEACLFAASQPYSARQLADALAQSEAVVLAAVEQLQATYQNQGRPYTVTQREGQYRLVPTERGQHLVRRLRPENRPTRLSRAARETLGVVVCQQPVSRAAIDGLRGRDSSSTLAWLEQRGLIARQTQPKLAHGCNFVTTSEFLELLGLASAAELPRPNELARLLVAA